VTKYLYSARILPIGRPVVIPDEKGGRRERVTFTEDNFTIERKSRNPAKVLLDHDLIKQIGKVQTLWRHEGWFVADFTLDPGSHGRAACRPARLRRALPVPLGLEVSQRSQHRSARSRRGRGDHAQGRTQGRGCAATRR
jgi:hypothetical protein